MQYDRQHKYAAPVCKLWTVEFVPSCNGGIYLTKISAVTCKRLISPKL